MSPSEAPPEKDPDCNLRHTHAILSLWRTRAQLIQARSSDEVELVS